MYTYETKFRLTNPVNDFDAAQEYLSEDDMAEYLRDDLEYRKAGLDLDEIVSVDWILDRGTEQSGVIRLVTKSELSKNMLATISDWVRGQCSDGLGEGFEQQPFAEITDEDDPDFYDMASFDWETNTYPFKLVSANEGNKKTGACLTEKVQNSVMEVRFRLDDKIPESLHNAARAWFNALDVSDWEKGLSSFPASGVKRASVALESPDKIVFRVYTDQDLNDVPAAQRLDIEIAVENFVGTELKSKFHQQPFGKKVSYVGISADDGVSDVVDEGKRKCLSAGAVRSLRRNKSRLCEADLSKFDQKDSQDLMKRKLSPEKAEKGKPVSIKPVGSTLLITFVNTDKDDCFKWVNDFLKQNGLELKSGLTFTTSDLPNYSYGHVRAMIK